MNTQSEKTLSRIIVHCDERATAVFQRTSVRVTISILFSSAIIFITTATILHGEMHDDWFFSVVLSGAYQNDGMCLFLNAIIANSISYLSSCFPGVVWFFVFERIVSWLAFAAIVYGALTYTSPLSGFTIILTIILLALPGMTYDSNFTFVSSGATVAGCVLILGYCKTPCKNNHLLSATLGAFLIFIGFLIRRPATYLAFPFLAIAIGYVVIRNRVNGKAEVGTIACNYRHRLKRIVPFCYPFLLLVILCSSAGIYDSIQWEKSDWSAWRDYNAVRATITDYEFPPYDVVSEELTEKGISESEYEYALTRNFGDRESFDLNKMEIIGSYAEKNNLSVDKYLTSLKSYLGKLGSTWQIALLLVVFLLSVLLTSRMPELLFALIAIVTSYFLCAYFLGSGRLISRIEYSIWIYSICLCLTAIYYPNDYRTVLQAYKRLIGMALIALLFIVSLVKYAPYYSMEGIDRIIDNESHQPSNALIDYLESHPDKAYAVQFSTPHTIFKEAYDYRNIPSKELLNRFLFLGGWSIGAPFIEARNEQRGLEVILRDIVDNPDVLVMSSSEAYMETLVSYIREHFNEGAEARLVDSIDVPEHQHAIVNVYEITTGELIGDTS